jgi:arylformamidase
MMRRARKLEPAVVIIDISPPLTPAIGVWPGDTPLSREVLADMADGANLTLSTLHATVHLGAHADAPNHYGAGAPGIGERPLLPYIGRCRVIRTPVPRGSRVGIDALGDAPLDAPRVLLATGTFSDPEAFTTDFAGLEPTLIDHLADHGVTLVGLDTPSVDLFESKDLPAHNRLLARDVAVLEGLILSGVEPGLYELIALPLKLMGFDASPVRAILRRTPPSDDT